MLWLAPAIIVSFAQSAVAAAGAIVPGFNKVEIEDQYIVTLHNSLSAEQVNSHYQLVQITNRDDQAGAKVELKRRSSGFQQPVLEFAGLQHTFNVAGSAVGYSGHFSSATIDTLRSHPDSRIDTTARVSSIERDQIVQILDALDLPQVQDDAPWGLARISHREKLNSSTVSKYLDAPHGGSGVDVYVLDTGVNVAHADFEGRTSWGAVIPAHETQEDGHGHSTHCAGIVAGRKYGVAKEASIIAVKVLNSIGRGTLSDVIKGVEFVAEKHAAAKAKSSRKVRGSVVNMSLGSGKSTIFEDVVEAAVWSGVHFAVAAGNENQDACVWSPQALTTVVTVGAMSVDDAKAGFSNHGKCVDVFAPGLDIDSAWRGGENASRVSSGTSSAAPHVAGLMAYLLSMQPDGELVTPEKLKAEVLAIATQGALSGVPEDTVNMLAWNGGGESI